MIRGAPPLLAKIVATGTPAEVAAAAAERPEGALTRTRFDCGQGLAHAAVADDAHPEVIAVLAAEGIGLRGDDERTPLHHAPSAATGCGLRPCCWRPAPASPFRTPQDSGRRASVARR